MENQTITLLEKLGEILYFQAAQAAEADAALEAVNYLRKLAFSLLPHRSRSSC